MKSRSAARLISAIRVSALKRGSFAQSTRKRKKASRSSVWLGPVTTRVGVSSGWRAVARHVAGCAGVGDAIETDAPLGEPHRQFLAFLPHHAEAGVADARLGQLVGEDARQHVENPVGNAGVVFRADGAVLEAVVRVVEVRRAVVAQEAVPADEAEDDGESEHDDADVFSQRGQRQSVFMAWLLKTSSGIPAAPTCRHPAAWCRRPRLRGRRCRCRAAWCRKRTGACRPAVG